MAIDTSKFWEFVKEYKGTASIKDVYAQFEKESSLDSFESKIVWASINSDLQDYFTKTAKTIISPDGTITIDNESPKPEIKTEPEHHVPIEPKTDLSPLPEASDHNPPPSTGLAPHASPTETTPEPTPLPPSNPPQNNQSPSNDGTVFDRLKEKS